jgi:hypothetical protein
MATRYIRIYEGMDGKTDVIGASASVPEIVYGQRGTFQNPARSLLKALGHKTTILVDRSNRNINEEISKHKAKVVDLPEDRRTSSHLEVEPPMSDVTVDLLAAFVVEQGMADGGSNYVMMFDQRPGHERLVREW